MERFLVVDDDEHITLAISKVLTTMGFDVITHTDPLKALNESNFDVVITDFMMPNLTGIDFLRKLRERSPHAIRLMITAANDFKVAMRAVNEGEIFRLLSKPWQLAELKAVAQQAVDYSRLAADNRRLTATLAQRNEDLVKLNRTLEQQVVERTNGLLEGMIRALDYRDTETQWHSWRVAKFTRRLAEEIGIQGDDILHIEQGALLHDIGKIGVRDAILLKPGPLNEEEWIDMRKHAELGWRMLSHIPYLRDAALIVLQHQEKWNGTGYPQKLKGEEIVIGARLFAIADTLDAITSDRPYRKGSPVDLAVREITRLAGSQFEPRLVDAFLAIAPTEWIRIRREIEGLEQNERRKTDETPILAKASGA